jgi:hypothetical protein
MLPDQWGERPTGFILQVCTTVVQGLFSTCSRTLRASYSFVAANTAIPSRYVSQIDRVLKSTGSTISANVSPRPSVLLHPITGQVTLR